MLHSKNRESGVTLRHEKDFCKTIPSTHEGGLDPGMCPTLPTGANITATHAPGSSHPASLPPPHCLAGPRSPASRKYGRGWPWHFVCKCSDRDMSQSTLPSEKREIPGLPPTLSLLCSWACPVSQEASESFAQTDSSSSHKSTEEVAALILPTRSGRAQSGLVTWLTSHRIQSRAGSSAACVLFH